MSGAPRLPATFRLVALDRVGSTNDEAKRLAAEGAAAGTVVWALEQSAGRGRQGRSFASPRGNLFCSFVLRPDGPPSRAAQLGMVAAVALADALRGLLPARTAIRQKWPNDVLIDGRKVSGILLESAASMARQVDWLVLGLGVNVVSHPQATEFPATDLAAAGAGAGVTASVVLEEFAHAFERRVAEWNAAGFAEIRRDWLAHAWLRGASVRVRLDRETLHGVFTDLDPEGALLLDLPGGARRRITAADMFALAE